MNYARGISMVKKTGKPHVMRYKGRYYTFKIKAIFGRVWAYNPRLSHTIMDEAASKYCRQMNQFR